ncbi:MAG: response regulator [Lysobacteraceae bacterium]
MAAQIATAKESRNVDRVNILLVDDQPARLLSYRAILDPLGENLIEAQSGTEALGRLMDTEFAVILLDVNMPGMDGFETASIIHEHPRFEKTPIIFVTAINVSELDRLRGYDLGAVDYVTVPVIPEILRSKVTVLAELFRKRRELQNLNFNLAAANEELRIERNREVYKLNETLRNANAELASANSSLEAEIAERRRTEGLLKDADRRKDEFLATLAHELRNPLAPIQSALNVYRMVPKAEAREQLLGTMERQLLLLVRLIDDLLDVSRITRGKLTLRKQQVEVNDVLAAAVETARPLIESSGHALRIDIRDGERSLYADSQRLAQVFANVLNNACKYTEPGGTIWLGASAAADELVVSIRDSGIGLTTEQRTHIFDLFMQVDASLERARGGLGIGLTLVRRLVEMHGGQVQVSSDGLGQGSEFIVRIPMAEGEKSAISEPADEVPDNSCRGLRILVVDDSRDGADMLTLTLEVLGHQVVTIYDPLKALAAAEAFVPELAFLDVGMPGLNGYELAVMLKRQPWASNLQLVALTGWGQEEDRRRSAEAGFNEHFVKPIDLGTIQGICHAAQAQLAGVDGSPATDAGL